MRKVIVASIVLMALATVAFAADCNKAPMLKKAVDYWVDAETHTIIARVTDHALPPADSIIFVWCPQNECTLCRGMWAALIEREYVNFAVTCEGCPIVEKLGGKFLAIPVNSADDLTPKYWLPCGGCSSPAMPQMREVKYIPAVWDPNCGSWVNAAGDYWRFTK